MRKGGRIERRSYRPLTGLARTERLEDRRLLAAVGPADGIGYIANPHAFEAIDLVQDAPGVAGPILDQADDGEFPIDLGSNTFTFYGRTYTGAGQLFVGSNGYLSFGENALPPFENDLTGVLPTAAIAPLFDDLFLNSNTNDEVLYKFEGDRLIIEWSEVFHFSTGGSAEDALTFQAILELNTGARNGEIVFNYVDLDREGDLILSPTVGIKDVGTGDPARLVIMHNAPSALVASSRAILIRYNHAPVAQGDGLSTNEDTAVIIAPLANDTDPDGDAMTAVVRDEPDHGTLAPNGDGTFTYTPELNYFGSDSFTYRATDGEAVSSDVTVAITVNLVNDAPVALADAATTDEDNSVTFDVLGNDTDVENDPLSAVLVDGPAHGTAVVSAGGSITYTPAADFFGSDSFTYRASDGAAESAVATVSVTVNPVNDAPVAISDVVAVSEDVPVSGNVLANDTDVDGEVLSHAELVSGPLRGSLTFNPDGSFTYTPQRNFFGTESFTYRVTDAAGAESVADVTLQIAELNDAPVVTSEAATVSNDATLGGNVLVNDSDPDNEDGVAGPEDVLSATLAAGPSHGSVVLYLDGRFTYTPAAGFVGTDSFRYVVSDGRGGSTEGTVSITVTAQEPEPEPEGTIELVPDATQPGKTALVITGTPRAELIAVVHSWYGVEVYFGCQSRGVYAPSGRVVVRGLGGNDALLVGPGVQNQAWLYGDEGNDILKLGHGGGIAFGGAGSDAIVGGNQRDVLVGGEGGDLLIGNPGDDILISALTSHDNRLTNSSHEQAWAGMYAEWNSSRSFVERVNNLRNCGAMAGRLNGSYFLDSDTLVDDASADAVDILSGSAGTDWLIYKFGEDLVTSLSNTEAQYDGGIA